MQPKSVKILLTGRPGCGKTTAVMKIIDNLDPETIEGFYTQELRKDNVRRGFNWKRLDGAEGTLAHVISRGVLRWVNTVLTSKVLIKM